MEKNLRLLYRFWVQLVPEQPHILCRLSLRIQRYFAISFVLRNKPVSYKRLSRLWERPVPGRLGPAQLVRQAFEVPVQYKMREI